MTTVAAVDCGTNTIKLLLGDPAGDPGGVVRESRMVRLGQGVDATGRLAPEALERAFAAIDEYAALIRDAGADRIRFCATSATRDASNAATFVAGVRARLGVDPEVLSGEEEARLAFAGAVRGLDARPGAVPLQGPTLVLDVGGGSTELILGDRGSDPSAAHSMDIGSVRLHERHVRHDPITPSEVAAIRGDIDAALDACPVAPADAASVVAVAGTNTTLAAGVLGLASYDRTLIHGRALAVDDVQAQVDRLLAMTVAQRKALGWMHPGRADVIDAGALIVSCVLARLTVEEIVVAETDILDGIAWSLA